MALYSAADQDRPLGCSAKPMLDKHRQGHVAYRRLYREVLGAAKRRLFAL
uniref:Uncharacterized protein n=1 Tax=uncultured marine virus TaxID=186617 RepID=A0A0F7L4S8_9VIRU|nr:hypothetical protein [uncultured marine virus]